MLVAIFGAWPLQAIKFLAMENLLVPHLITIFLSFMECLTLSVHLYWLTNMPIYGLMRDLLKISLPWLRAFATLFLKQSFLKRKGSLPQLFVKTWSKVIILSMEQGTAGWNNAFQFWVGQPYLQRWNKNQNHQPFVNYENRFSSPLLEIWSSDLFMDES